MPVSFLQKGDKTGHILGLTYSWNMSTWKYITLSIYWVNRFITSVFSRGTSKQSELWTVI